MSSDYTSLAGYGEWFVDNSTGDIVLMVGGTVVHRITSGSVVTATTFTGAVTGNVTGNVAGAVAASTVSTSGATTTTSGVGAIGADGTLVAEAGNAIIHSTSLTFTKGATVAAAALSWGAECYTLPAVPCAILGCAVDGYMQSSGAGGAIGDTGEVGVGILVGSGANATLGAVGATSENIITGTTHTAVAANTSGVADITSGAGGTLVVAASSVIYANAAGTWSAADDVDFVGTLRLLWAPLV